MFRPAVALLCVLATSPPLVAGQEVDGVQQLLQQLERVLQAGDRDAFAALFTTPDPDLIDRYAQHLFAEGALRLVVRERERIPPEPGAAAGWQAVADIFTETQDTARIHTVALDLVPPAAGRALWAIDRIGDLAAIDGLFRLELEVDAAFDGRDFALEAEDLALRLQEGLVFPVVSAAGVTGLVLVGRGEMTFAPTPPSEQGQLRLFAGADSLVAPFETAFIRLHPSDQTWRPETRVPARGAARQVARARQVFARLAPQSFAVDLGSLSDDSWHLLPPAGDLLAEVDTRRHGTLTYTRTGVQMEDVSLFHRDRRLTIAMYASAAKLAARGRFYSNATARAFEITDYDIEAFINPATGLLSGRAGLHVRVSDPALSQLTLHLAEPLAVSRVTSAEYGSLLHVRLRGQDTILVGLPRGGQPDRTLSLTVAYEGRLASQELGTDMLQVGSDSPFALGVPGTEPYYLLTGPSRWYPQPPLPTRATATLRLRVPPGYRAVATGEPVTTETATLREWLALAADEHTFIFRARRPVRYLAVVASRFVPVAQVPLTFEPADASGGDRVQMTLAVETTRAQQARGRAVAREAGDILRFYGTLMGKVPFSSLTVALLESHVPGGHSPAYVVALNEVVARSILSWREDPVSFDRYPEYVLAHEIAHQWWGQAVGWKNYREQWISEGFAQYLAALYAEATHGPRVFNDMIAQFRRTALAHARSGPIHLGQRVGHIRSDPRAHRAIVYNKGAAVLHMLRRVVGDELFTEGLRRFYAASAFGEAGSDDLRRTFEAVSGMDLEPFFEGWVYGSETPHLQVATTVEDERVIVRFRQPGPQLFDVPITVTLVSEDRRTQEVVVRVTGASSEHVIPVTDAIRRVDVNLDGAALVELSRIR